MKTEFHVHTKYSKDSILNGFFILLMCKIKKINCIAITDHNEIRGAIKYKKKLSKYNINVIVGEEILTTDGEIIGLFLQKKIEPFLSTEETIKKIQEQNGLIYIPHPYDEKRKKTVLKKEYIEKYADVIDLIEIHNGRNIKMEYSEQQKKIANDNNILNVVGSDAHVFWELGRNYVITEETISRENFAEIIKCAELKTKKCITFAHNVTKIVRCIKMISKGEINELYRIIDRKCKRKKSRISQ